MVDLRFAQWEMQRKDTYTPFERRFVADAVKTAMASEVQLESKPLILVDPATVRPVVPPEAV